MSFSSNDVRRIVGLPLFSSKQSIGGDPYWTPQWDITNNELRDLAREMRIPYYYRMNKHALRTAIMQRVRAASRHRPRPPPPRETLEEFYDRLEAEEGLDLAYAGVGRHRPRPPPPRK